MVTVVPVSEYKLTPYPPLLPSQHAVDSEFDSEAIHFWTILRNQCSTLQHCSRRAILRIFRWEPAIWELDRTFIPRRESPERNTPSPVEGFQRSDERLHPARV